jgi:hypothetical protein
MEVIMRRFAVTIAASTVFVTGASIMGAAARMVAPEATRAAADSVNVVENVQFVWLDHNYCWYDDGWNGPGWYWCNQYLVSGVGWGGGYGWHGWRGGHAGGARGGHARAAVVHGDHAGAAVVHVGHARAAVSHGGGKGGGGKGGGRKGGGGKGGGGKHH